MCLAGWPMPPLSRIIPFCGGTQTHLTSKSYLHQPRVGSRQAARFVYSTATALGFVPPALVSRPHSKGRRQTDQSSYDAPAPISLRIARHDRPHRSFLSHCESPEIARNGLAGCPLERPVMRVKRTHRGHPRKRQPMTVFTAAYDRNLSYHVGW